MAEIKKLQVDGADIYPVTHESAVYDNDGKTIESKYLSSVAYTQGDDIKIADEGGNIIDTSEIEAQIQAVDTKVGELSNLRTSDKDNIVDAINELFQSANNGKELIADAIGEPVSAEDTFQAMSDDINGLLSTFKANMINIGVEVESNDKFKALIDKIATMSNNKGLDIISATELPATGKEGQICVVMDNPIDSFVIASGDSSITDSSNYVALYYNQSGFNYSTQLNNQVLYYNFYRSSYNNTHYPSYLWNSSKGSWDILIQSYVSFLEYGVFNSSLFGNFYGSDSNRLTYTQGLGFTSKGDANTSYYMCRTLSQTIDWSKYKKIGFRAYATSTSCTMSICDFVKKSDSYYSSTDSSLVYDDGTQHMLSLSPQFYTLNISSWTRTGIFGFKIYLPPSTTVYITDVYLYS